MTVHFKTTVALSVWVEIRMYVIVSFPPSIPIRQNFFTVSLRYVAHQLNSKMSGR